MMMAPLLVLSAFSILFLLGRSLELSVAFAAIQMFDNLEHPIRFLPMFVKTVIEFNISMKRICKFLVTEESYSLAM